MYIPRRPSHYIDPLGLSFYRRLAITERTVKAHVTHILQRLGVHDRTQAALWAERNRPTADAPDR